MPLRIVFMGTAELACASLKAVLAAYPGTVVVTRPDRRKGRDLKEQPSPVKTMAAKEKGMLVLQPEKASDRSFFNELAKMQLDLIVVAAYGQILPQAVLDLPKFGCINVHTSLLPKYRGAAPIQWAILNNEAETGVSIMKMTAGLDTGDILSQRATPIGPDDTGATLHDRLAVMGAELLLETIPAYVAGRLTPRPQDNEAATYARKITKADGHLDWSRSALELRNRLRAFTPWPGAFVNWTTQGRAQLLKIWRVQVEQRQGQPGQILEANKTELIVACGTDAIRIEQLQLEGGRKMTAAEFLAGHEIKPGATLA
jgi:methionyl-tRNA formyltransferase